MDEDFELADACEISFVDLADDDETAELRALFPEGDDGSEVAWVELFGGK